MTATAVKKEVTINQEQRLYVIPCGDGYSCWGFDNCFNETKQLAERLGKLTMDETFIGTMEVYNYHHELLDIVRKDRIDLGTWFNAKTDPIVKSVIEACRIDRTIVRVFYGHTEPGHPELGRSWMDEWDMYGYISRSTGLTKIPILVAPNGNGGPGLLDACIIKIITKGGRVLYEHPNFHVPKMEVCPSDMEGYVAIVKVEGSVHARFKKPGQAEHWVAVMKGERMKP